MWVLVDRLGVILFDSTLSTAVFLSLMILAMLVCRQPARRLLIARGAFYASLLMFPLVALAPLPRLNLVRLLARAQIVSVPFNAISAPPEDAAPPGVGSGFAPASPSLDDLPVSRWGNWLLRALTLLDLAGIATGFAWLILGLWGVHWLLRQSQEPNSQVRTLYERLQSGGSQILAKTDVRVSGRLRRPAVVGLFQPTILIPASFDAELGDLEQLRLSLLHEMAHVERRDHWHGAIANLANTAWYLLPHVWWLRSQLRIDQEFLADRSAASRFGSASGYAASLLLLAATRPESQPISRSREAAPSGPVKASNEVRSPLFQRLLMLLHCPHRIESHAPRLWSWGLRAGVLSLSVAAACVYIRVPEAESASTSTSGGGTAKGQPFRVADFVAEPRLVSPSHRALAYVMPVILPNHFDLKVEVLATHAELAHTRIAGHRLGLPRWADSGKTSTASLPGERESWHHVRLVRDGQDLHLWVDAKALPVTMKPERTTEALTIEPGPERPVRFRNLVVEW